MKPFFDNNSIDFGGIQIGEYLTATKRKWGNAAYTIAQIERASHSVAIKVAGLDPSAVQQGVLDGLAQWGPTGHKGEGGDKRGSWWVYKKYADMDGSQTLSTTTTNHGNLVEVYATNGTDYGQSSIGILLGTFTQIDRDAGPDNDGKDENGDPIPIKKTPTIGVNIYGLEPDRHYDYNIYRLIDNGDDKADAPESIYGTVEAADTEGQLYVEVDWQKFSDCYYILIL